MTPQTDNLSPTSSIRLLPGIGRRTASLLEHTGVRTIRQLAAIPDYFLVSAFGPSLRTVRRHALTLCTPSSSFRTFSAGGMLASVGAWLLFRHLAR